MGLSPPPPFTTPPSPPPSSTTPPPMSPLPSSALPATTPTLAALSTLSRGRLRLRQMLTLPTTVVTSGDTTTRVPATAQPFLQQLKCMEIHPCSNFFFLLNKIKI